MGEHTPGPWHWRRDGSQGRSRLLVGGDKRGTYVLRVSPSSMGPISFSDANARLIAAAPDLLRTLEEVESFFTHLYDECDDCSPEEMCGYHAILVDARAAIAEARGERNG